MLEGLSAYIPEDRRDAMVRGEALPDRTEGAALFADLSGFTPMTEALTRAYGPHRGAEELTRQLDLVFGELIRRVDDFGGAVIGFSGDAITCWFDRDEGERATAAAFAMQGAMARFATIPLADGATASLSVKTAVVRGRVRRFLVGDPEIQVIDAVAGDALDLLAEAERLADSGDVVVAAEIAADGGPVRPGSWRDGALAGRRFAVAEGMTLAVARRPWSALPEGAIPEQALASWVLPGVYERLRQGLGAFLGDFRPAAALFLSFRGIDYDGDDGAGERLDAFVRWVQRVISAREGSLVQLTIGDKGSSYLYASFGAPVAHDDDAARAVAVALELRSPPSELGFVRDIRIGVTFGQMYAGAYGGPTRRTYGVLGAKTNLSARLMGLAEPGQVLCDEEVARHAARSFDFASLGSVKVKGKSEAVAIFAPSERRSVARTASADTPLIGREHDLATFESVLDDVHEGSGRVTFLEGEAGIGKSRLVEALANRARSRGAAVLVGVGQSGAHLVPYGVWRDVFVALLGLPEDLAAEERRVSVQERAVAAAPELLDMLPLLNDVLSLDLPETAESVSLEPAARQAVLRTLLIALLRHSAERPTVVVLEDAHWLDSLSWELAELAARTLLGDGAKIWLVLVHRPFEEHHLGTSAATALAALPEAHTVRLGPLDAGDLTALVGERLGIDADDVPVEVADLVRDRASGNPFIAEELLQTLRDQGLVTVEDRDGVPTCRVSPALAAGRFTLPDTLQGLILSRIDRLPADRQLVLKVASVIGRMFTMTPLRDTLGRLGWTQRALRPSLLRELARRGFVVPEPVARELSYHFRHVITHEIVYQTLLFAQRRQVHRALAEWYEATNPDPGRELTPLLAHHWTEAAEGSRDEALLDKAITYLKLAGTQALQLGAFPEASASYERGLALLPTGAEWGALRASLLINIASVLERTGDYTAARGRMEDGLSLARASGDAAATARALIALGMVEQRQGNLADAERLLEEALSLLEDHDEPHELARLWESLGLLSAHQGHLDRATERLEAADALHAATGNLDGASAVLNNLGIVALFRTDFAAARGYFERALEIARERGDRDGVGSFLGNLGYAAEQLGDYAAATTYLREALDIARELNARPVLYNTTVNLAHVSVGMDRDDEAASGYAEALGGALEIGAVPTALEALCGLAVLDHRAGRFERAAERLGLVVAHPAYNADVALRADRLLEQLRESLPAPRLEAAMARGAARRLEDEADLVGST